MFIEIIYNKTGEFCSFLNSLILEFVNILYLMSYCQIEEPLEKCKLKFYYKYFISGLIIEIEEFSKTLSCLFLPQADSQLVKLILVRVTGVIF